ncbi:hypothetical protein FBU30_009127 [Linnemannia zychae]|nr:hypothetical protein FBU30_009127 [Linnemannia zychae]
MAIPTSANITSSSSTLSSALSDTLASSTSTSVAETVTTNTYHQWQAQQQQQQQQAMLQQQQHPQRQQLLEQQQRQLQYHLQLQQRQQTSLILKQQQHNSQTSHLRQSAGILSQQHQHNMLQQRIFQQQGFPLAHSTPFELAQQQQQQQQALDQSPKVDGPPPLKRSRLLTVNHSGSAAPLTPLSTDFMPTSNMLGVNSFDQTMYMDSHHFRQQQQQNMTPNQFDSNSVEWMTSTTSTVTSFVANASEMSSGGGGGLATPGSAPHSRTATESGPISSVSLSTLPSSTTVTSVTDTPSIPSPSSATSAAATVINTNMPSSSSTTVKLTTIPTTITTSAPTSMAASFSSSSSSSSASSVMINLSPSISAANSDKHPSLDSSSLPSALAKMSTIMVDSPEMTPATTLTTAVSSSAVASTPTPATIAPIISSNPCPSFFLPKSVRRRRTKGSTMDPSISPILTPTISSSVSQMSAPTTAHPLSSSFGSTTTTPLESSKDPFDTPHQWSIAKNTSSMLTPLSPMATFGSGGAFNIKQEPSEQLQLSHTLPSQHYPKHHQQHALATPTSATIPTPPLPLPSSYHPQHQSQQQQQNDFGGLGLGLGLGLNLGFYDFMPMSAPSSSSPSTPSATTPALTPSGGVTTSQQNMLMTCQSASSSSPSLATTHQNIPSPIPKAVVAHLGSISSSSPVAGQTLTNGSVLRNDDSSSSSSSPCMLDLTGMATGLDAAVVVASQNPPSANGSTLKSNLSNRTPLNSSNTLLSSFPSGVMLSSKLTSSRGSISSSSQGNSSSVQTSPDLDATHPPLPSSNRFDRRPSHPHHHSGDATMPQDMDSHPTFSVTAGTTTSVEPYFKGSSILPASTTAPATTIAKESEVASGKGTDVDMEFDDTQNDDGNEEDDEDSDPENNSPAICPHCLKEFQSKGLLRSHIVSHSSDRPFVCRDCSDKSYKRNHDLLRHRREKHNVEGVVIPPRGSGRHSHSGASGSAKRASHGGILGIGDMMMGGIGFAGLVTGGGARNRNHRRSCSSAILGSGLGTRSTTAAFPMHHHPYPHGHGMSMPEGYAAAATVISQQHQPQQQSKIPSPHDLMFASPAAALQGRRPPQPQHQIHPLQQLPQHPLSLHFQPPPAAPSTLHANHPSVLQQQHPAQPRILATQQQPATRVDLDMNNMGINLGLGLEMGDTGNNTSMMTDQERRVSFGSVNRRSSHGSSSILSASTSTSLSSTSACSSSVLSLPSQPTTMASPVSSTSEMNIAAGLPLQRKRRLSGSDVTLLMTSTPATAGTTTASGASTGSSTPILTTSTPVSTHASNTTTATTATTATTTVTNATSPVVTMTMMNTSNNNCDSSNNNNSTANSGTTVSNHGDTPTQDGKLASVPPLIVGSTTVATMDQQQQPQPSLRRDRTVTAATSSAISQQSFIPLVNQAW